MTRTQRKKLFRKILPVLRQYDYESVAHASGIAIQTPYNWDYGYVNLPYAKTLRKVADVIL